MISIDFLNRNRTCPELFTFDSGRAKGHPFVSKIAWVLRVGATIDVASSTWSSALGYMLPGNLYFDRLSDRIHPNLSFLSQDMTAGCSPRRNGNLGEGGGTIIHARLGKELVM